MRTRRLGTSELTVSVVGLGCNNFGTRIDAREAARVVGAALDAGINHFDTAERYGAGKSEEFLGVGGAGLAGHCHPDARRHLDRQPGHLDGRVQSGEEPPGDDVDR